MEPGVGLSGEFLLTPEAVLPSQFFAELKDAPGAVRERRLYLALLKDAVWCHLKYATARDPKKQKLYQDAEVWVQSTDNQRPCSFENVCDVLEIDPDFLRRGLRRWRSVQPNVRSLRQLIVASLEERRREPKPE